MVCDLKKFAGDFSKSMKDLIEAMRKLRITDRDQILGAVHDYLLERGFDVRTDYTSKAVSEVVFVRPKLSWVDWLWHNRTVKCRIFLDGGRLAFAYGYRNGEYWAIDRQRIDIADPLAFDKLEDTLNNVSIPIEPYEWKAWRLKFEVHSHKCKCGQCKRTVWPFTQRSNHTNELCIIAWWLFQRYYLKFMRR